jgi:hypothetical protein
VLWQECQSLEDVSRDPSFKELSILWELHQCHLKRSTKYYRVPSRIKYFWLWGRFWKDDQLDETGRWSKHKGRKLQPNRWSAVEGE